MNASATATPLPALSRHPKVTPYRLGVIIITSTLGITKAVLVSRNRVDSPVTIEWITGVVVALSFQFLDTYEYKVQGSTNIPWMFTYDCRNILKIIVHKFSATSEHSSEGTPHEQPHLLEYNDSTSIDPPILTAYHLMVSASVLVFGSVKWACAWSGRSGAMNTFDWLVAVPLAVGLYYIGLYEDREVSLLRILHVELSDTVKYASIIALRHTFLCIVGAGLLLFVLWLHSQTPITSPFSIYKNIPMFIVAGIMIPGGLASIGLGVSILTIFVPSRLIEVVGMNLASSIRKYGPYIACLALYLFGIVFFAVVSVSCCIFVYLLLITPGWDVGPILLALACSGFAVFSAVVAVQLGSQAVRLSYEDSSSLTADWLGSIEATQISTVPLTPSTSTHARTDIVGVAKVDEPALPMSDASWIPLATLGTQSLSVTNGSSSGPSPSRRPIIRTPTVVAAFALIRHTYDTTANLLNGMGTQELAALREKTEKTDVPAAAAAARGPTIGQMEAAEAAIVALQCEVMLIVDDYQGLVQRVHGHTIDDAPSNLDHIFTDAAKNTGRFGQQEQITTGLARHIRRILDKKKGMDSDTRVFKKFFEFLSKENLTAAGLHAVKSIRARLKAQETITVEEIDTQVALSAGTTTKSSSEPEQTQRMVASVKGNVNTRDVAAVKLWEKIEDFVAESEVKLLTAKEVVDEVIAALMKTESVLGKRSAEDMDDSTSTPADHMLTLSPLLQPTSGSDFEDPEDLLALYFAAVLPRVKIPSNYTAVYKYKRGERHGVLVTLENPSAASVLKVAWEDALHRNPRHPLADVGLHCGDWFMEKAATTSLIPSFALTNDNPGYWDEMHYFTAEPMGMHAGSSTGPGTAAYVNMCCDGRDNFHERAHESEGNMRIAQGKSQ